MQGPSGAQPVSPPERRLGAGDLAAAAAFMAAAIAIRLLALHHGPDAPWPHSMLYEGDAPAWVRWAQALGRGEPFEADLAFRTPGVAFLLHWLGVDNAPFTAAKTLWCVLSAITAGALYLVVARWFTRPAAVVAAALCTASFGQIALATSLNNEAPYALLVVLAVGATLALAERPRWWLCAALGAMHGAAMLLRAEHMLLLAMLVVVGAVLGRRAGWRRSLAAQAAVVLVAVAACAPWSLRSHAAAQRFNAALDAPLPYDSMWPEWSPDAAAALEELPAFARTPHFRAICRRSLEERWPAVDAARVRAYFDALGQIPAPVPEWTLVSFKGPLDFALANDPRADGGFSRAGLADGDEAAPAFSFARPAHARLVEHGYAVGLAHIVENPARWLSQCGEKALRFADGATTGLGLGNWPFGAAFVREPVDMAVAARSDAPWWRAGSLALLGLGCIVAARRAGGTVLLAVLAYRLAVTLAFYGYARQSAAIGPVLFALMALGVDWCIVALRSRGASEDAARIAALPFGVRPPWAAALVAFASVVVGVAFLATLRAPALRARPTQPSGVITPAPQWAPDAFESNARLMLEPLPR
ncbi:MAG: glycosyltransferase family 39 protein [Planctomycetota bacterium]